MPLRILWAVSMLAFLMPGTSFSQFCPPDKDRGIFSFDLENDVWLKRDDGYTNGLNFAWVSPTLDGKEKSSFFKFFSELHRKILRLQGRPPGENNGEMRFVAFSLHQVMLTPRDLTRTDPIPEDRPYAGLLAVNTCLIRLTRKSQDVLGLTAGLVGPHSLAGKAQTWLHETYDWTRPMGWKNQLRDEPVLNLWFGRVWLLSGKQGESKGFNHGLKFGLNGQLGNLMTSAGTFFELSLGSGFRPELEVYSPAPFFGIFGVGRVKEFSFFGFLRAEGRVVVRNLLLEGNTFISGPGVKINNFYGQISTGLGYRNAFSAVRFYLVMRSKEFQGQKYHDPYVGLTLDLNL